MKTAKEISKMLSDRAQDVARYLFPQGKREGQEWCVGDLSGEPGKSLKIHLQGAKAGLWSDFAAGQGGDLLDLWSLSHGISLGATIKEASSYLGISPPQLERQQPKAFDLPKKQVISSIEPSSAVMQYLTQERKLFVKTINDFHISQEKDSIVFPYLRDGKVIFVKYLRLSRDADGKKTIFAAANCEPCLFGWHSIPQNSRRITICEGEIDAMTLHQYGIPALSVPFGGGSGNKQRWLEYEFDRLSIFDEIFLCLDDDEEGQKATAEIAERLGLHRCRIVQLPKKDANECLKKGISAEIIKSCFKNSQTLDPKQLKQAFLFESESYAKFYPVDGIEVGYHCPWGKVSRKILFRPSELNVWTGINGHGKSQFLGHVILGMLHQGAKICIASLELKPDNFLMRLTRQATGMVLPSAAYHKAVYEWYRDKLWLFNELGTVKSQWLLDVFIYARQRYGIDVFVIDSFMLCGIAEDDYKAQKAFIEKLCYFKNHYNCQVHLVSHPRKGADESFAPGKLDTKGTGAITDLADNCFTVWRNKEKERCLQKKADGYSLTEKEINSVKMPDCVWRCDKQRNGDWEGSIGFWYDKKSFQYLENEHQKPKPFVEFSWLP